MKGKNMTYFVGDVTLLRNVGSCDPRNDGWWINHVPDVGRAVRIPRSWALAMLRQWRRKGGVGWGVPA